MFITKATVFLASALAAVALNTNNTSCAPVHIMMAHGSTEQYPGSLSTLASLIQNATEPATIESILYPAIDESTSDSYFVGRTAVKQQLATYVKKCPTSKIVVLAYSQGVLIVGDALVGGGVDANGILGNATAPTVPTSVSDKIAAMIFFGNPRHVPDLTCNQGNGTYNATGKYPRTAQQAALFEKEFLARTQDYCNYGDPVCAQGNNITAHMSYTTYFNNIAANWVEKTLKESDKKVAKKVTKSQGGRNHYRV